MPFDYEDYQQKCNGMTAEQLQKEWENYTRQISAGATSTATSILLMPLTGGISAVGLTLSAPRIHNARKKREIIEAGLKARGTTHHTRKGDVLAPMAVSGIIGGLTLGLAPPGASDLAAVAVGRAIEMAATNTALNATEAVVVAKTSGRNVTANELSPDQHARLGQMPIPFLIEEAVLAFEHPPHEQPYQPPYGFDTSTTVVQASYSIPYDMKNDLKNLQNQHDPDINSSLASLSIQQQSSTQSTQSSINQISQTTSDAALFASIPIDKHDDVSDLLNIDEEDMLKMHALALAMEKHEVNSSVYPASTQIESRPSIQTAGDKDQSFHLTGPFQPEFENIEGNEGHLDETASCKVTSEPDVQEERPALPPRQEPRATTLPARFDSPRDVTISNQDTQQFQYPPQSLPPYQPQYFAPAYQATEPQQYYPPPEQQQYYPPPEPQQHHTPPEGQKTYPTPPPPQQRQDSGYVSMYSTHSTTNTPQQTYYSASNTTSQQMSYPPPDFVSRHSSIPQSHQQITIARKPVPYHPGDPNHNQQPLPHDQVHRSSDSSLYPMTPPPPYYQPPSGMASAPLLTGKEHEQGYFTYAPAPQQPISNTNSSSYSTINPLLQQPQKLVDGMNKGWQWARAAALPTKTHVDSKTFVEPNYGPPPSVPAAWRGS
ncbi:hypothetical protein L207DRAFT_574449 [Hyaloscypha variabilis F]|uniref:Uncharacterized protein n=1 Tax=Hyaloscypha variabilis (strain UAMH 11265 / GT02V1 / F) TaxID=1149755 RepID=A0A2J6QSE0_HYAVF|nr:hypothetical protein L207DRAFT_574449 [Hyaloscypha variabilis F]